MTASNKWRPVDGYTTRDEDFESWPQSLSYLWLVILINHHIQYSSFIYKISKYSLHKLSKSSKVKFNNDFEKLQKLEKIFYSENLEVLLVKNALHFERGRMERKIKLINKFVSDLPECEIKTLAKQQIDDYLRTNCGQTADKLQTHMDTNCGQTDVPLEGYKVKRLKGYKREEDLKNNPPLALEKPAMTQNPKQGFQVELQELCQVYADLWNWPTPPPLPAGNDLLRVVQALSDAQFGFEACKAAQVGHHLVESKKNGDGRQSMRFAYPSLKSGDRLDDRKLNPQWFAEYVNTGKKHLAKIERRKRNLARLEEGVK